MHERHQWRLTLAAVFLAPMVIVKAAEMYLSAPIPQHVAAVATAPIGQTTVDEASMSHWAIERANASKGLTVAEKEAVEHILRLKSQPVVRSPFKLRDSGMVRIEESAPAMPIQVPALRVQVQAVMRSEHGNIALIDGTVYRVGDFFSDGDGGEGFWTILAIEPASRSVRFEHSSGAAEETRTVLK